MTPLELLRRLVAEKQGDVAAVLEALRQRLSVGEMRADRELSKLITAKANEQELQWPNISAHILRATELRIEMVSDEDDDAIQAVRELLDPRENPGVAKAAAARVGKAVFGSLGLFAVVVDEVVAWKKRQQRAPPGVR